MPQIDTSFLGGLEEVAGDLYPYRWPITIALAAGVVLALYMAWRLGWHRIALRHRVVTAAVVVVALAVLVPLANYTLSPLWERSRLNEASPLVDAAPMPATGVPSSPGTAQPSPFVPRLAYAGEVTGEDDFHFGRGKAQIIETAPGRFTLRFEEFSVRNGPDLFVYLSRAEDGTSVEGAVNLGRLKATDGAFNYEIPAGTDITQYRTAIVWCRQFAVLFASAPIAPV